MATVGPASTLPWAWYADEAVLRLEREAVFGRSWQYAARADQVAEPGRFAATRAGHIPVVVARARDGALRAFVNVCRHRGSILCEGEGRRETIQCPYHAWTYELDGRLRTAPRSDREPDFDPTALSLVPVAVDTWGPFVFVNPDQGAAPLAETLGDLPALVAGAGVDVDALRFHHRAEGDYEANWKLCVENYLECYHCQVAHPGFARVVDVSEEAYALEESRWSSSQFGPAKAGGGDGLAQAGEIGSGQFHFLFPNTTINVNPGYPNLSIGPVIPLAVTRAHRFLDYWFAPDVPAAWIEDMLAFDDQVGAEDRVLVERVQQGVGAGVVEAGVVMRSERLISHFRRLLADALGG
ncbi:MAG TPA: aromatic ring-hydroxylating dioxygenase subunit alpha [Gaiellaceae bacterium]